MNYFSVTPSVVLLDDKLTDAEKILYGIISSLTQVTGFCWASNERLGEMCNKKKKRVSQLVSALKEHGYLSIYFEYKENSKEIKSRKIYLNPILINKPKDEKSDTPPGHFSDIPPVTKVTYPRSLKCPVYSKEESKEYTTTSLSQNFSENSNISSTTENSNLANQKSPSKLLSENKEGGASEKKDYSGEHVDRVISMIEKKLGNKKFGPMIEHMGFETYPIARRAFAEYFVIERSLVPNKEFLVLKVFDEWLVRKGTEGVRRKRGQQIEEVYEEIKNYLTEGFREFNEKEKARVGGLLKNGYAISDFERVGRLKFENYGNTDLMKICQLVEDKWGL